MMMHLPHQRLVEFHVAQQHLHQGASKLGGQPGRVGVSGGRQREQRRASHEEIGAVDRRNDGGQG